MPVAATQKISMLEDITVYMKSDDLTLKDIFLKMADFFTNNPVTDPKSDQKILRSSFAAIFPDYDEDKVYSSDIKKMFSWYLLVKDFVTLPDEGEESGEAATEDKISDEAASNTAPPAKKTTRKTASTEVKKEITSDEAAVKKTPRKKTAKKSATDTDGDQ
jgi:hypothetical protein